MATISPEQVTNKFTADLEKIYRQRRILWFRVGAFTLGVTSFIAGPVLSHLMYRLWFWAGAGDIGSGAGAVAVEVLSLMASAYCMIAAFNSKVYNCA